MQFWGTRQMNGGHRAAAKLQELLLYGQDTKDSRFKATK